MNRPAIHAACVVAAVLATAAPVARAAPPEPARADLSKRVEIRTPAPPTAEAVQAALRAIEGEKKPGGRQLRVNVRATAEPEAGSVVRIDVTGDTLPADRIPDAVRSASPELAGADVSVRVVQASVDADVAGLVGSRALAERLDAAQIEEEVRSRLARDGVQGDVKVDVKTEEADGKVRHEVNVTVEKKEEAGAR